MTDGSSDLNPYRWYLTHEARDGAPSSSVSEFRIEVEGEVGEEESTILECIAKENNDDFIKYDLYGNKISTNSHNVGIMIKKGNKQLFR